MDIILRHINKSYGEKPVIQNVTLTARSGSFTTLLGPSGCGKTTLLRMIAGLDVPDTGEIILGDRCVFSKEKQIFIPPEKRGLGFVFQDFALWPHMTVFENVAFGLRAAGHTGHLHDKVMHALDVVQLAEFSDRYPHQLSGGQQQRVSFARAIVTEPDLILFDEPLSALDALLRADMRVELRELTDRLHITSIFVTHDQGEAMSMSDRIAVLSQGHIEQYDRPEVIYSHPATPFTARFVGSSNWIDSHRLFRPEKASTSPAKGSPSFHTTVLSSQFLGSAYQLRLQHEEEKWTYLSPSDMPAGTALPLYVQPADIIVV